MAAKQITLEQMWTFQRAMEPYCGESECAAEAATRLLRERDERIAELEKRIAAIEEQKAAPDSDVAWFCRKFRVEVRCEDGLLKDKKHPAGGACVHPVPVEPLTIDRVMEVLHKAGWYSKIECFYHPDITDCCAGPPTGQAEYEPVPFADRLAGLLKAVRRAARE